MIRDPELQRPPSGTTQKWGKEIIGLLWRKGESEGKGEVRKGEGRMTFNHLLQNLRHFSFFLVKFVLTFLLLSIHGELRCIKCIKSMQLRICFCDINYRSLFVNKMLHT